MSPPERRVGLPTVARLVVAVCGVSKRSEKRTVKEANA
jgi:hypothetical protein